MEDTLRYFFSAVLQAFAAILTLGAMFILQALDKLRRRLEQIEESISNNEFHSEEFQIAIKEGKISALKEKFKRQEKEHKGHSLQDETALKSYDDYEGRKNEIIKDAKRIMRMTLIILITSIIALFLVGYGSILNIVLFLIGIVLIVYSLFYFYSLMTIIKTILHHLS